MIEDAKRVVTHDLPQVGRAEVEVSDLIHGAFWINHPPVGAEHEFVLSEGVGVVHRVGALSGCTVPEIAAITGHSLEDVEAILDGHYLGGRIELAVSAIEKLDAA